MSRRITISEATLKAMLDDRASGMPFREIAQKYGFSLGTTMRSIRKQGVIPQALKEALKTAPKFPRYWRDRPRKTVAKSLILDGSRASLSVRKRQLVVFEAGREVLHMPGKPPFANVLVEALGFQVTGEALAWLNRHNIGLIVVTPTDRAALPVLTPQPLGKVNLRIAQYAAFADPLPLAKIIVAQKIRTSADYEFLTLQQVNEFFAGIQIAPDLQRLHMAEGVAALAHFNTFRTMLRFKGCGKDWPETWNDWTSRQASLSFPSPRNALHPVNAILNYAYTVAAAQLSRALSAWGFDVAIGFLHTVQENRASLAYDAVELFRASIDARILSFLGNNAFRREDFGLTRSGVIRLTPEIGRVVAGRALATKRDLNDFCAWLESEVLKHARKVSSPILRSMPKRMQHAMRPKRR